MAGQLAHARGLAALASPNVNSYRRLHAGPEAPGAAVWAHNSRAALIRVSSDLGEAASVEFRGADPQANPYLLLAGLLLAGAAGVTAGLELDPPNEESVGGYDPVARTTTRTSRCRARSTRPSTRWPPTTSWSRASTAR